MTFLSGLLNTKKKRRFFSRFLNNHFISSNQQLIQLQAPPVTLSSTSALNNNKWIDIFVQISLEYPETTIFKTLSPWTCFIKSLITFFLLYIILIISFNSFCVENSIYRMYRLQIDFGGVGTILSFFLFFRTLRPLLNPLI